MYGWRARIGHVAPSRGDTLVYEFYKMFPEGFMMLNTTGTVRQLVDSDFEAALGRIEEAVKDLVENNCDSIFSAARRCLRDCLSARIDNSGSS